MTQGQIDGLQEAESLIMGMWVRDDKQTSLYFCATPCMGGTGKVEVSPDEYQMTKKEIAYNLFFKNENDLYLNMIETEKDEATEYQVLLLNADWLSLLNVTDPHQGSTHFERLEG